MGRACLGASIAIDDCYELWESGFISIPHSFQVAPPDPLSPILAPEQASHSATPNESSKRVSALSQSQLYCALHKVWVSTLTLPILSCIVHCTRCG